MLQTNHHQIPMSKDQSPVSMTNYKTEIPKLSDLKNYIGKELGVSPWIQITQSDINTFAKLTKDEQWIHTNPSMSAQLSPYKKTVAHGFFILSLASHFCYESFSVGDVSMGVNYGLDKVRFMNATKEGSFIRAIIKLLEFTEFEGGAKYKVELTYEIKGDAKPACVAEFIAQAYVSSSSSSSSPSSTKETENQAVLYEEKEGVAIITLNRPERYNAVNDDLISGIQQAIKQVRKNDSIRAVVMTGAGKGFCAGADMSVFGTVTPEEGRAYLTTKYQPLMRDLFTLKKPIIAAVNGTAAGVGASIALACDFRVMQPSSSLLYAFINIGLGPDGGGSWLLARQVGYSKALELAIEGNKIDAETCERLGLTNKIVPEGVLMEKTLEWAKHLAQLPTLAVGITKEDMFYASQNSFYDTIAFEAERQVAAFGSYDNQEGISAFLEKRKPKFIGK